MIEQPSNSHSLFLPSRQNVRPVFDLVESVSIDNVFQMYQLHNLPQVFFGYLFVDHIGIGIGVNDLVP